jgi:hypothetical protein
VTERRGYPVKDVAVAGGRRDEQTRLRSYQHADADRTGISIGPAKVKPGKWTVQGT